MLSTKNIIIVLLWYGKFNVADIVIEFCFKHAQRSDTLHNRIVFYDLFFFIIDVFDAMIYPSQAKQGDTKSKGFSDRIAGAIGRWFGRDNNSETEAKEPVQIPIFDLKQMRSMCLKIYVHDELNLIRTGAIERGTDILGLFTHITTVHHNLCYASLQDGQKQVYNWSCQHLLNVSHKNIIFSTFFI